LSFFYLFSVLWMVRRSALPWTNEFFQRWKLCFGWSGPKFVTTTFSLRRRCQTYQRRRTASSSSLKVCPSFGLSVRVSLSQTIPEYSSNLSVSFLISLLIRKLSKHLSFLPSYSYVFLVLHYRIFYRYLTFLFVSIIQFVVDFTVPATNCFSKVKTNNFIFRHATTAKKQSSFVIGTRPCPIDARWNPSCQRSRLEMGRSGIGNYFCCV
jgi:hypothetical protein